MSPQSPRRTWSEMTAEEIRAGSPADWVAVIPLGAIEQHGPHLPLITDSLIGAGLLALAFDLLPEDVPATALPMIEIGKSDEHLSFPGTLSFSAANLTANLIGTAEGAIRAGVKKIVFINAHGGNSPVVDIVIRELRVRHPVLAVAAAWSRFGVPDGLVDEDEIAFGIHGGAIETSLMLYLRPDLVRMEAAEDFGSLQEELASDFEHLRAYGPVRFGWLAADLNPAGVVGNAAAASPEIGRTIAGHQAAGFAKLCAEVHDFDLSRFAGSDGLPE